MKELSWRFRVVLLVLLGAVSIVGAVTRHDLLLLALGALWFLAAVGVFTGKVGHKD